MDQREGGFAVSVEARRLRRHHVPEDSTLLGRLRNRTDGAERQGQPAGQHDREFD
jgi:hypothetical protein